MTDINPAIVEKAARAKFKRAHPWVDDDAWGSVDEHARQRFRDSVTRTLTPVYADIQAAALREAANDIDLELAFPIGEHRGAEAASEAWLRLRADELDGGTT